MFSKIFKIKSGLHLLIIALMMALSGSLYAQQTAITGKVIDQAGEPVIGATVFVRGTSNGAVTDVKGIFNIEVKKGAVVSVTYMGYKPAEFVVDDKKSYSVVMTQAENVLVELVATGYGSTQRGDLTGSVASVSGKDVEGFKSSSVMEALGGQIAGVQITKMDGAPGGGFDIKIRGIGTLTGSTNPLYIVDGFQVDNIDYLASSDIENISVLKDASSSAIYGARAANGVVMVTTKSGKAGKTIVNYNGSATYRAIAKKLDLLSPYEFAKLQVEINPAKYGTTYYKPNDEETGETFKYNTLEDYIGVGGVDWQKETFNPTWSQDHNISVRGGNKETNYTFSFSNFNENGIFTNSSFEKNNAKLRINQKLNSKITLDASVNYTRSDKRGTGTSADGGRFNMLAQIFSARPTGGLGLTDEQLLASAIDPLELQEDGSSLAQVNPIVQAQSVTNTRKADQWVANASINIEIAKGLTFKTAGTYNMNNIRTDLFYLKDSKEAYRNGGNMFGSTRFTKDLRWTNYNYLTYKYKKNKDTFEAMIGQESNFRGSEYILAQGDKIPTDISGNDNLDLAALASQVGSGRYDKLLLSYFGRVNYNYKERYLLTATIRRDGSSVFSPSNKWGWFPSFSAAWRVSEEGFMKRQDVVSNLKLRAGWGVVGNDGIDSYLSMAIYSSSIYGVGQNNPTTVFDLSHIPNMNIKWEGSSTTNIGVDFGLLRNRISVTVDAFVKNTKDLLLAKSLAHVTGFNSQYQNVGKIQNKGIELGITSTNVNTRNFTWKTDFNISFISNTLKELQPGETRLFTRTGFDSNFTNNDYIAMVGQSLGLMYGFEFDGVYQLSDMTTNVSTGGYELKPGVTDIFSYAGKPVQPGFVKYKDQDGDGVITAADRTVIGNGTPKWFGGITNTFYYKDFDFGFMFQFNYGNDVYNATRMYASQSDLERTNKIADVANRWTMENSSNEVHTAKGYVRNDVYSRFIEDGSFLRLKSITLGYSLPKKWSNALYMSSLRVNVSAQNLFVISSYKGYDPEVSMRATNPMTPSFDWGAYPRSKVLTIGLDIQF